MVKDKKIYILVYITIKEKKKISNNILLSSKYYTI